VVLGKAFPDASLIAGDCRFCEEPFTVGEQDSTVSKVAWGT
jgi:hypothetical protein